MSSAPADKKHPYGHARYEDIGGMLVSCLIFMVGIQFFISSLKKTISPEKTEFSLVIGILIFVSIVAKVWQSEFYKTVAKPINSKVLLAASVDSRNDVIITSVVLFSAIIEYFTGFLLDGPIGILVSLFVIRSSIELLRDTISLLLGAAPKEQFLKEISEKIVAYPTVLDVHDLIVHNYGADSIFATAHVEILASQNILISHDIIDQIERDFLKFENINLVIHLDPIVSNDPEVKELRKLIEEITIKIDSLLSIHDFRVVESKSYERIIFDVTVPNGFELTDEELRAEYRKLIKVVYPKLESVIIIDRNFISTVH